MWWFLSLLALRPGLILADDTLYISPISMRRRENETVTLDCFTSRNLDDHFLVWGSAKPTDKMISWILYWTPGSTLALHAVPGTERFTGSKNWASKRFSLTIMGLQRDDSARYYCGSSNSYFPYSTDWSGCGVTVTVDPAPPQSPPVVHLHQPRPEDLLQQEDITLLCVAEDFYPEGISISWSVDGQDVDEGVSQTMSLLEPNATFTEMSKLTIATAQWTQGSVYSCHVSHSTLPSPVSKHVSNTAGQYSRTPKVYALPPSFEELDMTGKATVACLAAGYYPGEISFRWLADRIPVLDNIKSSAPVLYGNGTYCSRSELVASKEEWNQGTVYSCEVQHVSVPHGVVQSIYKTNELNFRQPTITPIRLQTDDEVRDQKVTLACYVSGFYPADIYVTWRTERDLTELDWVSNFPVVPDASGTYSTASQMTILLADVNSSLTYVCVVGHESLSYPIEKWFQIRIPRTETPITQKSQRSQPT